MKLSAKAESLIADFARNHGLKSLAFDGDGLIPITLGQDLHVAIGYSEANDSFFLSALIATDSSGMPDPMWAFRETRPLSPRRTRIGIEPETGAVMLVSEVFAAGIAYWEFAKALETFVADADRVRESYRGKPATPRIAAEPASAAADPSDFVMIRP